MILKNETSVKENCMDKLNSKEDLIQDYNRVERIELNPMKQKEEESF